MVGLPWSRPTGEVMVSAGTWEISAKERDELPVQNGCAVAGWGTVGSLNGYDNTAFPLRNHTDKAETRSASSVKNGSRQSVGEKAWATHAQ